MSETHPRPESTTLQDEEGNDYQVEQSNVGFANMKGDGEWPDPDAPPEAPAPGTDEGERRRIEAQREGVQGTFKDVLEADPDTGGSKSTPD